MVIREQYANGSLGPPTLLFPSWRILGGLNSIPAGQALEIPEWSNPRPYFRIARPTPDQRHELLTVLVTPQPLQQLTPGGGSFRVPAEMLDAPPEGTALSSVRLPLLP